MTKHRPNRFARFVFRMGVTVCVLIATLSAVSIRWQFGVTVSGVVVSIAGAGVLVYPATQGTPAAFLEPNIGNFVPWILTYVSPGGSVPAGIMPRGWTLRGYPLWMPFVGALIPAVIAWKRLRRPLPGHCRKCGYDLTGNTSGTCPECGRKTDAQPIRTNTGVTRESSNDDLEAIS